MESEAKNWSLSQLNEVHKLAKKDYAEVLEHINAISSILNTYPYVRDTEYKDTTQISNLDILKDKIMDIKCIIEDVSHES